MRTLWLLFAACIGFSAFIMLILVSKFIFPFRESNAYESKPEPSDMTVADSAKPQVLEQEMDLPAEQQFAETASSRELSHEESVQIERLELLRNMCGDASLKNLTYSGISKFVLDRIFVCDKYKILFCQTPKVGNTQWKKVLIVLNGAFSAIEKIPEEMVHNHEKNSLPRLSSYSKPEITKRLNSYFKFLIVRDPFERLISAFKDKFLYNPRFEPWYKHDIAPAIIQKYRKNRNEAKGLQFEDFVRYLGDPNHRWLDVQFGDHIIHWTTYVELCAPCEIQYNVIGHHETLDNDASYILKKAGVDHLISYPPIPPGITEYNRTKVEQYFLGLSKRDKRRLYARFQGDFKLFGYREPSFLLT